MFEGGGLLTLTSNEASNSAALNGNITLFDIGHNERGHLIPRDENGVILEQGRVFRTATGQQFIVAETE
jgi:hypothetical protein